MRHILCPSESRAENEKGEKGYVSKTLHLLDTSAGDGINSVTADNEQLAVV